MSDPLYLPLRPSNRGVDEEDSLLARIFQIQQQRGSFRHVSEQSLLEEISAKPSADKDVEIGDVEDEEVGEDRDKKVEKLYKGREEILRQVNTARNDAYSALDFVSLLLTKHNSRLAEASMSPVLKERVPTGTVELKKAPSTGPSAAEKTRIELVSSGWKVESLSSSGDRLSEASNRLQREAVRESKYWEQVSRIKSQGWTVSRVPQERHTLGVRFGFAEATPAFRNRGFAALRSREDGNLYLDSGSLSSKPKAVEVSIYQNEEQIGASTIPADASAASEDIVDEILQARNSLFEDELFYEMNREARAAANLGFTTGHNLIKFDLKNSKRVEFRLMKLGNEPKTPSTTWPENATAEMIALSLRLLLSRAHRHNHKRRTKPPPPMTSKPRQVPEYALLRPVISLLQHRSYLQELNTSLEDLLGALRAAGLDTSLTIKQFSSLADAAAGFPPSDGISWLEQFTRILESTITVKLPSSPSQTIDVRIQSYLGPPILGTSFNISEISWKDSLRLPPSRHTTLDETRSSLTQIIIQDIATTIQSVTIPSPTETSQMLNLQQNASTGSSTLHWSSDRPFSTTFTPSGGSFNPSSTTKGTALQFQLTSQGLLVRYTISSSPSPTSLPENAKRNADGRKAAVYAWLSDGSVVKEVNGAKELINGDGDKAIGGGSTEKDPVNLKDVVEETLIGVRQVR